MQYSVKVRHELFDLVCSGTSMLRAAAQVGVARNTAQNWWSQAGGMTLTWGGSTAGLASPGGAGPGGPGHRLNLDERITIMRGRDAGLSYAKIAEQVGRDKAVVWREVRRNASPDGDYHAGLAHSQAHAKARRPKPFKLADPALAVAVTEWMDQGWSPRLIALVLAVLHPGDRLRRVSHETIYQALYVQTRGHLRADLHRCLSTKRARRKSGSASSRSPQPLRRRVHDQQASRRGRGPGRARPLGR